MNGKRFAWQVGFSLFYIATSFLLYQHNHLRNVSEQIFFILTLGRKRGDLKNLWTRGVPERPRPHVQDEHSQEFNEEK